MLEEERGTGGAPQRPGHRHPRGGGAQPRGLRRADPPAQPDGHHGSLRLRQVLTGLRHAVPGGAAPLPGDTAFLRAPVRGRLRAAGGAQHRGSRPRRGRGPAQQPQQSPLHRGHPHRRLGPAAPALRAAGQRARGHSADPGAFLVQRRGGRLPPVPGPGRGGPAGPGPAGGRCFEVAAGGRPAGEHTQRVPHVFAGDPGRAGRGAAGPWRLRGHPLAGARRRGPPRGAVRLGAPEGPLRQAPPRIAPEVDRHHRAAPPGGLLPRPRARHGGDPPGQAQRLHPALRA